MIKNILFNQKGIITVPTLILWGVAVLAVAAAGIWAAPKIIQNFKAKTVPQKESFEECVRRTGDAEECSKISAAPAVPKEKEASVVTPSEPAPEVTIADLIISNEDLGASADKQKQLCSVLSGDSADPKFAKAKNICAKYSTESGGIRLE